MITTISPKKPSRPSGRKDLALIRRTAALLLLLSVVLSSVSCVGSRPGSDPVTSVENTEAAVPVLDFLAEGSGFALIRPEAASEKLLGEFIKLNRLIRDEFGAKLDVRTDWTGGGVKESEYEILFGMTSRKETSDVLSRLKSSEYTVAVEGTKIVIAGNNDDGTVAAAEYFIENILPLKSGIPADFSYVGSLNLDIESVLINGTDLRGYAIKYEAGTQYRNAAKVLSDWLSEETANTLATLSPTDAAAEHMIVLTGKGSSGKSLEYDDFGIYYRDGSLYIAGGSIRSLEAAVWSFIERYLDNRTGVIELKFGDGEVILSERAPSRDEYIADPSLLPMHWAGRWSPEDRMTDYSEKVACLMCENKDHIFTVSHRGDFLFYPENSIESIISVWRMGGDCVEIDVRFTSDGIPVLMHDATLTRMTDVAGKAGKNGLPDSKQVSDWTLAQLRELRLLDGQGNNGNVTPYLIPTLEECLKVAKGRIFFILDKQEGWRYADIPGLQPLSQPNFIYPWMEKTDNFESVLISYGTVDTSEEGTFSAEEALKLQKTVYERSGQKMFFFLRGWTSRSTADPYAKKLCEGSLTNAAVLVNGAFNPNNDSVKNAISSLAKKYPDCMFGGWTIDSEGFDVPKTWDIMYRIGLRSIMTNNMFGLVKYAARKTDATPELPG